MRCGTSAEAVPTANMTRANIVDTTVSKRFIGLLPMEMGICFLLVSAKHVLSFN
jgi:hypothetical protein